MHHLHDRRLVGIDLGIIAAHTVRVRAGNGSVICRRKAVPTVASLAEFEQAALAGTAPATRLEAVIEPTGPAWLRIAVVCTSRGHSGYRVSSAKAHDLRRVPSRQAKSNGIDADTLARLLLVDPAGLHPLALPSAERAALDRRVRTCDRLTQQAAPHKRRIKDLVRQLLPTSPLTREFGMADAAVLERSGSDPYALLAAGPARLARQIAKASGGHHGSHRATQWLDAVRAALKLHGDHPAIAACDLAAEVQTEVRLLRAGQAELAHHAPQREDSYHWVDPLGLAPKASETGDTDRKGQPISKASSRLLRTTLVRAADNARRTDPQLARLYYLQMAQRRNDHLGAVCVVAAHLAERAWTVTDCGMPYVVCDTDGTPEQAKAIIAQQGTVPEEVRQRRRRRKTKTKRKGKAPQQVLAGHDQGARSATRRPSPSPASLGRRPTNVKLAEVPA